MLPAQALVSEYKSLGNQKEAAAQAAASKLEAELKKAQVGRPLWVLLVKANTML
jgi:hypothetical protein